MKKYFLTLGLCLSLFVLVADPTSAQQPGTGTGGSQSEGGAGETQTVNPRIPNPFKCPGGANDCDLKDYFNAVVEGALLPIGGVVVVIAIILSGFKFVTAQGNPQKIEEAKKALLYTAIGAAILLGAVAISAVITGTINALKS